MQLCRFGVYQRRPGWDVFYLDIFKALAQHKVRYLLVGGRTQDLADLEHLRKLRKGAPSL